MRFQTKNDGNKPEMIESPKSNQSARSAFKIPQQADEALIGQDVAAGLPRQISDDFSTQWRRKAASTPIFISLLVE